MDNNLRNGLCFGGPLDRGVAYDQPRAFVARDGATGKAVGFYVYDGMDECFRFVSADEVRSGIVALDAPFVDDADLAAGFEAFMAAVGDDMAVSR